MERSELWWPLLVVWRPRNAGAQTWASPGKTCAPAHGTISTVSQRDFSGELIYGLAYAHLTLCKQDLRSFAEDTRGQLGGRIRGHCDKRYSINCFTWRAFVLTPAKPAPLPGLPLNHKLYIDFRLPLEMESVLVEAS